MAKRIQTNQHNDDGIDRRGFLECMAWAGTGVLWSISGGTLRSRAFGQEMKPAAGGLHFVQISDSHMGFKAPANPDVASTLQAAIDKINALPVQPEFILHTGDLTHNAKAGEYDNLDELLKGSKAKQVFYVPGEHDTAADNGRLFLDRYAGQSNGNGWYSFTHSDVHFVGINNCRAVDGIGKLGTEQIEWLQADLKSQPSSRPIVVFAHIPLWSVYPEWGWATKDSEQAMTLLKRFGSVTVLNGHIHQTMRKVEGNVTFHSAMSTAFPQPAPGSAPSPGPMKVPEDKLRRVLGITEVNLVMNNHSLAVVDSPLEAKS